MSGNVYYPGIDVSVRSLIRMVNQHPEFRTELSCGGHYRLCPHILEQRQSRDDWDLEEDEFIDHQYCSDTRQPFVMFEIPVAVVETDKTQKFLDYLENTNNQKYPSILYRRVMPAGATTRKFTYGYSNGDEGFSLNPNYIHEVVSTRPFFFEFWAKFLDAWKLYIQPECDTAKYQPRSFLLKSGECDRGWHSADDSEFEGEFDAAGDIEFNATVFFANRNKDNWCWFRSLRRSFEKREDERSERDDQSHLRPAQ